MKFIVSSTDLFSHLQAISRVISSKNTLPILDCFLFEIEGDQMSVTASDNETTITTHIKLTQCDLDGRFAIISKTFMDALKEIPEQPLSFDVDLKTLNITINYQNGTYSLVAQNADEFPLFTALDDNTIKVDIEAEALCNSITRTLFATADDELRPVMNGIYFDITTENITFVSSDGHKLVKDQTTACKGNERAAFILPKKPATVLKSLLLKTTEQVTIEFNERNAVFMLGDYRMNCRLIEGRYPNYNSVIPQNNPYKITIDRPMFLSALKRVSVFSNQSNSLVKLQVATNNVSISAQDIDFSTSAKESIPCQYEGDEMSIGFKSSFLIEILNSINTDNVIIELTDPSRAGIIVPEEQEEGDELLMLLMPMMIND